MIAAIIQVESGGRNGLTSSAGAQGIMQIMPATQHYLGITDPFNPEQNIEGGIRYFKEMLDRFGGDTAKALRAYNAGPGNVPKGQMPRYKYVDDVMAIYNRRKSARNNNSNNTQQPPNVSASGNKEQPQSTQNNSTQGNSTTATRTATDPIVMARGNGQNMEVITQSQLDRLIEAGANEGLSPQIVIQRLINDEGYTYTENSRGNQPIFSLNTPNTPYIYEPHLPGAVPRKYSVPTQNQTTPNNNSGTVTALGNNHATPLNRDSPLLNDPIFRDLILRLFR